MRSQTDRASRPAACLARMSIDTDAADVDSEGVIGVMGWGTGE